MSDACVEAYSHQFANIFCSAAATGGFVDRLAETKGLNFLDKERAKHEGQPILVTFLSD